MPTIIARLGRLKGLTLLFALASLPLLAACNATTAGQQPAPTATAAATATASPTTPAGGSGIEVKVFFSKHPETDSNVQAVFPVKRISPTTGVATYATQQLIAGPTASERGMGYFTELTASLTGASNCGGPDFQITLDTHIDTHTGTSSAQPGTAVLKFCRATQLAGDLVGPRIKAQLNATLTQFPTIKKVQILTNTGHCFDDASGQDNC
jgi:spore germination protein GerM